MNGAQEILVIILASALAVFIVLAIIATILFIKVMRSVKKLIEKAEHITDAAETVTQNIRQAVSSLSLVRWVENITGAFRNSSSNKNNNHKGGV